MAGIQLVLTGVPAFVNGVVARNKVRISIDENDYDPGRLIEVDLARNTHDVAPAAWAQDVDVDHQLPGGLTTIGPKFHAGPHVGGVYLAERLVKRYATVLASWPPAPDERYQYQAIVRSENGIESRYHGFKVRVVSAAVGSLAHVAFIRVGSAAPDPADIPRWVDLANPAECDPGANGFTTITPSSPVGTEGALFMSAGVIAAGTPSYPKYPRNLGW